VFGEDTFISTTALESVREMSELIAPEPAAILRGLVGRFHISFISKLCIAMCAMYPLTLGIGSKLG
jgi:hypothetical protein